MFTLAQAIEAVANKSEFSVKDRGEYVVIDYNLNNKETFVGKNQEETNILLNLRGTAFDKQTGNIIRLGYKKFFNYGEFPEQDKQISWDDKHVITQKLDGSLIFPIYAEFGTVLGTRAGVTDISLMVDQWLNESNKTVKDEYNEFIEECRIAKYTPLFEFCSRKNKIVLDYPETQLVLTGIRDMETGNMITQDIVGYFGKIYDIPVVKVHTSISNNSFSTFHQDVQNMQNDEGVVVLFNNGHMLKIKSTDYCLKHKAIDGLKFEKDLFLITLLGELDDVLPLLSPEFANRINQHSDAFLNHILRCSNKLKDEYSKVSSIVDQKEFAQAINGNKFQSMLFMRRKGMSVYEIVLKYAIKQCSTQEKARLLKEFIGFTAEY